MEGVVNHTSSEVIKTAMTRQGVLIAIVDWTCHLLGNRNITITKRNITLRGLLWSLVVDQLLHLLTDQGCHPIRYADDILVLVRSMHLDELMGVMQQTLKVVNTWCETISDPRPWELVATTTLPFGSTHNQARCIEVSSLPRFDFTLSVVEPRSKILFLSTSCQSGAKQTTNLKSQNISFKILPFFLRYFQKHSPKLNI